MSDTFKVLAQGQLPSTIGTLYTAPGSTAAIVKSIHLVNTDSATRTASLTVNGTAAANQILPPADILAGGWADYEGVITLAAAETISGVASVASKVTYTIFGDEVA